METGSLIAYMKAISQMQKRKEEEAQSTRLRSHSVTVENTPSSIAQCLPTILYYYKNPVSGSNRIYNLSGTSPQL